jgi:hypothetical protein
MRTGASVEDAMHGHRRLSLRIIVILIVRVKIVR